MPDGPQQMQPSSLVAALSTPSQAMQHSQQQQQQQQQQQIQQMHISQHQQQPQHPQHPQHPQQHSQQHPQQHGQHAQQHQVGPQSSQHSQHVQHPQHQPIHPQHQQLHPQQHQTPTQQNHDNYQQVQNSTGPTQGVGGPIRVQPQIRLVRPAITPYPQGGTPHSGQQQHMRPITIQQPNQGQQFQSQFPQQVVVRNIASVPNNGPPPQQNHPAPAPAPPTSNFSNQPMQNSNLHPHPQGTVVHLNMTAGALIDKVKLDDLVHQIDPSTVLEDNVKDALVEYADEFVNEIIDKVCRLVQHRGNKRLETRDVEMVLSMVFNLPSVPRVHVFGAPPTVLPKLDGYPATDAHKQRLALIRKQLKKA